MNRRVMKLGFILITIALIFASSTTFGVNNSYAQTDQASEELNEVFSAFKNMDYRSQEQLISNISSTHSVSKDPHNLKDLDIEGAILMVQQQRTALLDELLKEQIEAIKKRNQAIADLNEKLLEVEREKADLLKNRTDEEDERLMELEQKIKEIKDTLNKNANTQQMEMLRLQQLSNKRNEAFEVMTDFIKKLQDNRASIISNMR